MERLIIVSNRLPLSITRKDGNISVTPSVGGLATGMKSFYKSYESLWVGWSGINEENLSNEDKALITDKLSIENCVPIHLTEDEVDNYYYGFSNKTLWPLFHYFTQNTKYVNKYWDIYKKVNEKFAETILEIVRPGDRIWIHDYHLMLLPELVRAKSPKVLIGFFMHIPFPSYEVFRVLPWRNDILNGILGADLVGFHTYDYERHFMSCVRRLLGHESVFNLIRLQNRTVKVDNFPMGIDYQKFKKTAEEQQSRDMRSRSTFQQEIDRYFLAMPERKLILSIDRLDYSKGIARRLEAYNLFLKRNPEYLKKITLVLLAVPSREGIDQYQQMREEVDKLVGQINGKYGDINWIPIWYFYRSLPFDSLISLYSSCDMALVTPVRDGMNLVSKEYIACRTQQTGVLILSEMAGASKEMGEALIVNPHNRKEVANAIREAIEMPEEEQVKRNKVLQERLESYDVIKWAQDFMNSLIKMEEIQEKQHVKRISLRIEGKILEHYQNAEQRLFLIDYDGTLVNFVKNPADAKPDEELYAIINQLTTNPKNTVVIISGRDQESLGQWFANTKVHLIAEHGVWMRRVGKDWIVNEPLKNEWKETVRPSMQFYVDRTPGSFIEEKQYSLVWHYRKSDPDLGMMRAVELKDELRNLVQNLNLEIMDGRKVVEIKPIGINKGRAAMRFIGTTTYDFILAVGDDRTDEHMFEYLPPEARTVKVGMQNTQARYSVQGVSNVRELLNKFD